MQEVFRYDLGKLSGRVGELTMGRCLMGVHNTLVSDGGIGCVSSYSRMNRVIMQIVESLRGRCG